MIRVLTHHDSYGLSPQNNLVYYTIHGNCVIYSDILLRMKES